MIKDKNAGNNTHASFLLTLIVCLYIPLLMLRIARVHSGFSEHFYTINSMRDILFIVFAFFQDIVFCAVLFVVFRFLLWIPFKKKIKTAVRILIFVFSYFTLFLTVADLFFFKTFAKPMTWNGISSELAAAGDFVDSAFSLFTDLIWVAVITGIVLIGPGTYLIYHFFTRKIKLEHLKMKIFRIEFLVLVSAAAIFSFNAFFLVPSDDLDSGIRSLPVYRIPSTFFARRTSDNYPASAILDEEKDKDPFSSKFSRDSRHFSLDPLDRKVQQNINQTLDNLEDRNFNVIFYLCESIYSGRLKQYGGKYDVMPRLAERAKKSLFLENMYSSSVRSMNSLVSLLTGLGGYPGFSVLTEVNPRIETPALSQILHEKGYSTGLIHSGGFSFYEKLKFLKDRDFDLLIDRETLIPENPEAWTFSWGIDDKVMIDRGLDWIDQQVRDEKNFFLTFVPILPHSPYGVPEGTELFIPEPLDYYHKYLNSLYYVDRLFDEFLDSLEQRELLENTIVVFVGDHGEAFGILHPGNRGHSNNILEENIRIPAMFFNPLIFDREYKFKGLANTSDIFSTVLDILDIEIPYGAQGESVFDMNTAKMNFVGTGNYDILVGLNDGNYKAIYNFDKDTIELYDLTETIVEKIDISEQETLLSSEYKQIMKDYYIYQTEYYENFNEIISRLKLAESNRSSFSLLELSPAFFAQNTYTYQRNLTAKKNPIIINGETYKTGIGVYANSVLVYDISGLGGEKLTGSAGKIDLTYENTDIRYARSKAGSPGNIQHYLEMIIKVDGVRKFSTGKITNYQPVIPFSVDISDASELEFIIKDAGDGDVDDNCVWIDPQILIKSEE